MEITLLTFGGGSSLYRHASSQLAFQALKSGYFDQIINKSDYSLKLDKDFGIDLRNFIRKNKRGFGYWIWKPFLVQKYLNRIKKNDLLIYLDAGCRLNLESKSSKNEFDKYIDLSNQNGSLAGQLKDGEWGHSDLSESAWTKAKVLNFIELSAEKVNSNQIQATWHFFKKTNENLDFVKEWLDFCKFNNFELIRDAESFEVNYPNFIEHRHDQSIFSCLYKKYNKFTISDDTWWDPNWDTLGSNYPIWAMRAQRKLDYENSKRKIKN